MMQSSNCDAYPLIKKQIPYHVHFYVAGIARLCCDSRRSVRGQALTYLQRALLVHDLQTLSAMEWEACFNKVRLLSEHRTLPRDLFFFLNKMNKT